MIDSSRFATSTDRAGVKFGCPWPKLGRTQAQHEASSMPKSISENGCLDDFVLGRQCPQCCAHVELNLGRSCSQTGPSWGQVAPSWSQVGPKLEPSGSISGPSWGLVGPSWPQVEPMLRACGVKTVTLVAGGRSWNAPAKDWPSVGSAPKTLKRIGTTFGAGGF